MAMSNVPTPDRREASRLNRSIVDASDRENVYRWQDARDARMKEWHRRKKAGLRPGPYPDHQTTWRGPRKRHGFFVAIDRLLPPGYRVNFVGDPAIYVAGPAGAVIRDSAISKMLFSRNQARKALRVARKRFPGAELLTYSWLPDRVSLSEVEQVWCAGRIEKDQLVKVGAP